MQEHAGEWRVQLRGGPSQHTQWSYFTSNPQGGGFGTNLGAGTPQRTVHAAAIRVIPAGATYHLYVNGTYRGLKTREA
jgi:hypothetical protein